jgi:hypothetical protein
VTPLDVALVDGLRSMLLRSLLAAAQGCRCCPTSTATSGLQRWRSASAAANAAASSAGLAQRAAQVHKAGSPAAPGWRAFGACARQQQQRPRPQPHSALSPLHQHQHQPRRAFSSGEAGQHGGQLQGEREVEGQPGAREELITDIAASLAALGLAPGLGCEVGDGLATIDIALLLEGHQARRSARGWGLLWGWGQGCRGREW